MKNGIEAEMITIDSKPMIKLMGDFMNMSKKSDISGDIYKKDILLYKGKRNWNPRQFKKMVKLGKCASIKLKGCYPTNNIDLSANLTKLEITFGYEHLVKFKG